MANERKPAPSPKLLTLDADGLAENSEPAFVVLNISRREIESGNIAGALDRLLVLVDSARNVRLYRESLAFQVGGYDDDPREITEIPEVRAFFRRLSAQWPHWLWFLHREIGAVGLLLALLCDVRVLRDVDRRPCGTEFRDQLQLARAVADLLDRGNALFAAYDITETEASESVRTAASELLGEEQA